MVAININRTINKFQILTFAILRRASILDVDAEEDIPCPGTDVIGLVGVEDVTLVIVDKLATETLGGNGGKGMFSTEVMTTTTSADVLDGDDVVGLGVWSSTLPS